MQERCESCQAELRVVDSYLALEETQELEVVRWGCARCGAERESTDRVLEAGRRVA